MHPCRGGARVVLHEAGQTGLVGHGLAEIDARRTKVHSELGRAGRGSTWPGDGHAYGGDAPAVVAAGSVRQAPRARSTIWLVRAALIGRLDLVVNDPIRLSP